MVELHWHGFQHKILMDTCLPSIQWNWNVSIEPPINITGGLSNSFGEASLIYCFFSDFSYFQNNFIFNCYQHILIAFLPDLYHSVLCWSLNFPCFYFTIKLIIVLVINKRIYFPFIWKDFGWCINKIPYF